MALCVMLGKYDLLTGRLPEAAIDNSVGQPCLIDNNGDDQESNNQ